MAGTRRFSTALLLFGALLILVRLGLTHGDQITALVEAAFERLSIDKLLKILFEMAVLLPLAALIELFAVGWRKSSLRRLTIRHTASSRTDILIYLAQEMRLTKILFAPLGLFGTSTIALLGNGVIASELGIAQYTSIDNPFLGFVVYFILGNVVYYWIHRAQHSRLLWPLHRMHHSAEQMTLINMSRHNIFSEIIFGAARAIPMSLICVPDNSLLAAQFVAVLHGYLHHSNWTSDWGWFGRWILVSPLHHRLHHSALPDDYNTNMATMPIFDRLFGTFRQPIVADFPLGLDDPAYRTTKGSIAMLVFECFEAAGLWLGAAAQGWARLTGAGSKLAPLPPAGASGPPLPARDPS